MLKYSKQRETILNNLKARCDHPTADMVYVSVRKELPNISLGTVYRNLSVLSDTGQVLKIQTGVGPDRFDGILTPHSHFICKCCGKVQDMDYAPDKTIITNAISQCQGQVDEVVLQFYGTCDECLKLKKKN